MSEEKQWYYIKNWFKFQHYKDRRPPWIKLHRSIETDPAIQSLSEIDQWRLVKLWLLASDMEGRVPSSLPYLRSRLRYDSLTHVGSLLARIEATGLISQQDIRGVLPTLASTSRDRVETEKNNPPTPLVVKPKVVNKSNGNGSWKPRADWPTPFMEDGKPLKEPLTGDILAVSRGGRWAQP